MKCCTHCGCQNDDRFVTCSMCGEVLAPDAPRRIVVQCLCGETYYATEQHIGRQVKCPKCLRILVVGQRNAAAIPKPLPANSRAPGWTRSPIALIGVCGLL